MLTMFLSWLRGYVVLHISGGAPERLLNLALQRDIDIYDINWLTDDLLEVKAAWRESVSDTHLTLPTICSV